MDSIVTPSVLAYAATFVIANGMLLWGVASGSPVAMLSSPHTTRSVELCVLGIDALLLGELSHRCIGSIDGSFKRVFCADVGDLPGRFAPGRPGRGNFLSDNGGHA
jgi:hypothetical protein